jgi:hypothetical protein
MTTRTRKMRSPAGDDYPTPLADMLARAPGVVDFATWCNVRLTERAMAGDVDACISWLRKFGGPPWSDG